MPFITNHKNQSFLITLFLFIPIFYILIYSKNFINIQHKDLNKEDKINLAIKHFIQQTQTPINKQTPKNILEQKIPTPNKVINNPIKKPIPKANQPVKSKPLPKPQQTIPLSQPTVSNSTISSTTISNNDFLKEIKLAIDNTLVYPRQAQKMRMSGEVLVEFTWTNQQILKNLKVITPSKYKLLNESALQTIHLASKYFPKYDQTFNIRIPIIYKIN
ncbi:energy transduction protein TonB [Campylobacter insulaenigrae NCTC 12927]|uniref:Energy transduction protein TonB n=2 Tax=Campylobacter insulaenigrae TaxID=260714 RepID=A0A0A8H0I7_9BACT|nr:energy transduction protein TonB [Campylobacter insulaenigrae NCTC 12927]